MPGVRAGYVQFFYYVMSLGWVGAWHLTVFPFCAREFIAAGVNSAVDAGLSQVMSFMECCLVEGMIMVCVCTAAVAKPVTGCLCCYWHGHAVNWACLGFDVGLLCCFNCFGCFAGAVVGVEGLVCVQELLPSCACWLLTEVLTMHVLHVIGRQPTPVVCCLWCGIRCSSVPCVRPYACAERA
jgi:hypothetical protein